MRMKSGDLKRIGSTGSYSAANGYGMVYFHSGIVGARSPDGGYTELEEKAADIREAKRLFVAWANRHMVGLE